MKESKHTSGPWLIVDQGADQRKPLEIRGWRTNPHAATGPLVCKMADVRDRATARANAQLIIAAPDMLNALIEIAFDDYLACLPMDIQRQVLAAIAKAKGE